MHDPKVFRNILLSYAFAYVLMLYVCFFSTVKNLYLTLDIISQHHIPNLFAGSLSNLLVFGISSISLYLLYWFIITVCWMIPIWSLSFVKIPQYYLKVLMLFIGAFILAYCYTDNDIYAYGHRHIHQIWSFAILKSPVIYIFLKIFALSCIATIFILFFSEKYHFKYSIRYFDKIILSFCFIFLISFNIFLTVHQFHSFQLYQGYINHFIGLDKILHLKPKDDFFYVENTPQINITRRLVSPKATPNIVIIGIKDFSIKDLESKKMPCINKFQHENLNFMKHIPAGNTESENIFAILYGLPINYLPSILSHQNYPFLFQWLEEHGYTLITEPPQFLYPFENHTKINTRNPQNIISKKLISPFFIFYEFSIDKEHQLISYANIEEKISHLLKTLESTNQYQKTIIILTSLSNEGASYIPFLMHWPQIPHQDIQSISSHYDILATLTQHSLNSPFGLNLLELKNNRIIPTKINASFLQIISNANHISYQPLMNYSEYQTLLNQYAPTKEDIHES